MMRIIGIFETKIKATSIDEAMIVAKDLKVEDIITFDDALDYDNRLVGVHESGDSLQS